MKRRSVLTALSLGALGMSGLASVSQALAGFERRDDRMPALFVGHGSPMNAIEDNRWSLALDRGGREAPPAQRHPLRLRALGNERRDGHGDGPAADDPRLLRIPRRAAEQALSGARRARAGQRDCGAWSRKAPVALDDAWGLDHGTWSVLAKMFPRADIPVVQLSLDATPAPAWHYELAESLSRCVSDGVLIMGSGNIVHNLRRLSRQRPERRIRLGDRVRREHQGADRQGRPPGRHRLSRLGRAAQLSVPTNEHYLPLLYALAVMDGNEPIVYWNDAATMGSISMRSLSIG